LADGEQQQKARNVKMAALAGGLILLAIIFFVGSQVLRGRRGPQPLPGEPRPEEMPRPVTEEGAAPPPEEEGAPPPAAPGPPAAPEAAAPAPAPAAGPTPEFPPAAAATLPGDPGLPLEPYRDNPFVPPGADQARYVAALPRDPGAVYRLDFPRPDVFLSPKVREPEGYELQPVDYMIPSPTTRIAQPEVTVGVAVPRRPGVVPRGEAWRMPGRPQPIGVVGPRVEMKPVDARLRRLSGVVHDGQALAILETFDGQQVRTQVVQPGDRVTVGTRTFVVRAISGDRMILREVGRDRDIIVRLRRRTANEQQ